MKTRIISALLAAVMLSGIMPIAVHADATAYDLRVAGVQITDSDLVIDTTDEGVTSGKATFDPQTNTLTLDNFSCEYDYCCIEAFGFDLNVKLVGENTITAPYAICIEGNKLAISGENRNTDKLIFLTDNLDGRDHIYAETGVSIKDCTVTTDRTDDGRTINVSSSIASYGKIEIDGCYININTAYEDATTDCGIYVKPGYGEILPETGIEIKDSSIVANTYFVALVTDDGSGIVIDNSELIGNGIATCSGGDIMIKNGSVVDATELNFVDGICAGTWGENNALLTIADSKVESQSLGAYGNINIEDSTVDLSGAEVGIWCDDLSITDSVVNTTAEDSYDWSSGISCINLTILRSKVLASGGNASSWAYTFGIDCTLASITDSTVKATAGAANYGESFGIRAAEIQPMSLSYESDIDSGITITNSSVIATGKTKGIDGNVTLIGNHTVYTDDKPSAPAVTNPTEDTYESKYVKIVPVSNDERNPLSSGNTMVLMLLKKLLRDVVVNDGITGGTVVSDVDAVRVNETVTVTVTPDEGCKLVGLTVTNNRGKAIKLTQVSETEYTFKVSGFDVFVDAEFAKIDSAT